MCAVKFSAAQNVGIGTTTPLEKLHVAGNIKADTLKPNAVKITANAGNGKLLTSDAAGNASWQENNTTNAVGGVGFGSWGDCSMNGIAEYYPVTDSAAAERDGFGASVAMSGNFAIVGVPGVGTIRKGYAAIYQFNGTNWIQTQHLTDPGSTANDNFGNSVAISGNFAIVGAATDSVGANANQGAAFIFQFNGSSWVFMQKITDPGGAASDFFGFSVALSGNNAVVGSVVDDIGANTDQGSASVFHFNGNNWVFVQKLTDPSGAPTDDFGSGVAISGNFILVGASQDDIGTNTDQGSACFFKLTGSNWVFNKKITDSTGNANEIFGITVSLSDNFAVIGAPSANGVAKGAAIAFRLNGGSWDFMDKLTDPTGVAQSTFGNSVCVSGNYLVVGDAFHENAAFGNVIIYDRIGLQWQALQNAKDPQARSFDKFGNAVAIDGASKRFLVGMPAYAQQSGKAIFGKIN
ncbi:hypothetical protein GCM10027043_05050 [Ferruginibacter profundus]